MRIGIAISVLALSASQAMAQDFIVYGGAELEFTHDEDGPGTGLNSALSGYVEAEAGGFYAGIWAKVADDDLTDEINLYLGFRNDLASGVSYDVGYTRYFYPNDGGDCCGELTFGLGVPVSDQLSASLDLAYDPEAKIGNAYVGAAFAASDRLEISANFGIYEVEGAGSETEWDLGATWALGDETAVDLRYYDGSEYLGSYVGLSLTWDSTLLGG
jgi:uncharacterized protein (TIGR02001 family)